MSQKGIRGTALSLLSCRHGCHGSPARACTASTVSSGGKIQLQQQGHLLQNQTAPTQNLAMGATNSQFLCFGRNLQCAHLHWTLSTGSHSQFHCQKVGKGNGFFVLEGTISHSRGKAVFIYPYFPVQVSKHPVSQYHAARVVSFQRY